MSNSVQHCQFSMCRNSLYPLYLIVLIVCLFSSCRIVKPTAYFRTLDKDTSIAQFVNKDMESKIVKNDILAITVSSLNKAEDEYYNGASLSSSSSSGSSSSAVSSATSSRGQGYSVDLDGNIQIHNLGKVHVEGMTRKELKDSLELSLLPYLKDPIVTVNFSNRRVTILGEILKPQVIEMQEEQMSLLDVLALSGDVTPNALKKNILVIRTTSKGKTFKHMNLEDESLFKDSSWYNLQSGDIVYVEPNIKKLVSEQRLVRFQQDAGIISLLLTAVVLILEISRR
jgi:polysaccharide export outer membrane protein